MLIHRKKLYEVANSDGRIEEHYREYKISFKSKNQLSWIMIYFEDKVEMLSYANIIWRI